MRKHQELSDPASCINRAKDDEMVFVLLGRDEAAPAAIYAWIAQRCTLGKNRLADPQIQEAIAIAKQMGADHAARRRK